MLRAAKERVRAWLDGQAPLPAGRSDEEVADVYLPLGARTTKETIESRSASLGE